MIRAVVWDFDGVLNRTHQDGEILWARHFDRDIGPLKSFQQAIFYNDFRAILTAKEDLLSRVAAWARAEGAPNAEAILDYWFSHDANPDEEVLALADAVRAQNIPQVIATNNEPRRTAYIAQDMGMAARVGPVHSSGTLGVAKPDPAFFDRIATLLALPPEALLLVDDTEKNVTAARALGWQGFHFTDATRIDLAASLPL